MSNLINVKKIEKFMGEKNFTRSEFCKFCKIPEPVFEKIITQDFDFDTYYLFKMVKAMGMHIVQIFQD